MAGEQNGFAKPRSLGSKARSFIPMTPRSLKPNHDSRNEFAKQIAEQSGRGQDGQPPQKKFRSSAAPKGSKLASGYVDRARERMKESEDAGDDKRERLKALEDMLKEEKIDQETFEKLREEMGIGGDTLSTHLVKGLDFKLLERVRRGEDVTKTGTETDEPEIEQPEESEPQVDVDDELEKALDKDVTASSAISGQDEAVAEEAGMEATSSTPGAALSRDELLRRLKQNRKNPGSSATPGPIQEALRSDLNHSKFRKLESANKPEKKKYTESINGRRREVLEITGKDGKTKRKTRWLDPEPGPATVGRREDHAEAWGGDLSAELLARQKAAVEAAVKQDEEDEEDDIFGGVADYNPLAGMSSDEEEESEKQKKNPEDGEGLGAGEREAGQALDDATSKPLKSTSQPRNYFATSTTDTAENDSQRPGHDPSILAALKRAAQIRRQEEAEGERTSDDQTTSKADPNSDRSKALLKKLQQQSRQDDQDLDMGFGGDTRDDEDDTDIKQKLSEWKGAGNYDEDEDEDTGKADGGAKRKRGGKKKKGDKNSFTDVMNVIEGRKKRSDR